MYKIILLIICYFTIQTTAIVYQDCGSDIGSVVNISFTDCNIYEDNHCTMKRNSSYTLDFMFTVKQPVQSLSMSAKIVFGSVKVKFPVPHPMICDDPTTGVKCPLLADGTVYHYTNTQIVHPATPTVAGAAEVTVKDEKNQNVFCMLGKGKVVRH